VRDNINIINNLVLMCMFLQSLVESRDCSSVVTAFNDTTGGLDAMEIAKMVQKLNDCTPKVQPKWS
jgi:hypothetical protein